MTIRIVQRLWVFILLVGSGCSTATAEKDAPDASPAVKDPGKASVPAALRAVPADAIGFVHVRLADVWTSAAFAEVRPILAKAGPQALEIFEKKYVPAPSTIDSITAIYLTAESMGESVFYGAPERV